jgi:hypothetical protein
MFFIKVSFATYSSHALPGIMWQKLHINILYILYKIKYGGERFSPKNTNNVSSGEIDFFSLIKTQKKGPHRSGPFLLKAIPEQVRDDI